MSFTEAKEGLELEISGLRSSYDHLSAENQILQARTQKFHALEGIKATLISHLQFYIKCF